MKTKITISLFAAASFLLAETTANAQQTQNFLTKFGAAPPAIVNSPLFDNSGLVGIGTQTAAYPFTVMSVVNAGTLSSGGNFDVSVSANNYAAMGNQSTPKNAVFGSTDPNTGILFATYNGSSFDERVHITPVGNFGIGIVAPTSILHTVAFGAKTATYSGNFLTNTATSSTASITKAGLEVTSTGTWNGSSASNIGLYVSSVTGGTNNYDAIFNGGGNVGIGTTAPLATLQLKAATSKEFQFGNTAGAYTSSTYFTDLTTVGPIMNFSRVSDGAFVNSIFNYTGTGSLDQLGIASRNDIVFVSSNSPTTTIKENMRITGGNVGIGTSAPATKLHITGDAASVDLLKLQNTNGTNPRSYRIGPGAGIAAGFGIYDDNAAATRMVIDFSGNVGIGTTTPGYKLDVQGGDINASGSVRSAGVALTSDQQFKINVDSLQSALTIIRQLKPKSYYFDTLNFNGEGKFNFSSEKQHGFVAQDVEILLPELVSVAVKPAIIDTLGNIIKPAYTYRALNYIGFISILTKGIQELQFKNDSLQSKVNNQDSVNTSLQNQVNQLTTNNTLFQNQLNQMMTTITNCCNLSMQSPTNNNQQNKSMIIPEGETTQMDVELNDAQTIVLQQNLPNPFAERTSISYYLPDNTGKAQILFYNAQGKLIQSAEIIQKGKGTLNVFASDLSNGIYTYTLVVDGLIIETKKMIKQ